MTQDAENIFTIPLHHRSRERIKELGEVFTTEKYVDEMLNLIAKNNRNIWADENVIFFEPTCGHGNFVSAIIARRLKAIFEKAKKRKEKKPELYAAANTVNTLWAIDIDAGNIRLCRERVFSTIVDFIVKNSEIDVGQLIKQNKSFIAHLLSCLKWQINENEALSALLELNQAKLQATKTIVGQRWIESDKHKSINFDLNWVEYFKAHSKTKIVPIEYQRSLKFITDLECSSRYSDFDFCFSVVKSGSGRNRKNIA